MSWDLLLGFLKWEAVLWAGGLVLWEAGKWIEGQRYKGLIRPS